MMRFLRKGDCYALEKPIRKYYYLSLSSFKCWVLSVSTYCYQFSCNVQESRASGATGYGARLVGALAHAIQVLRTFYKPKSYQLDTCLTHEPHMNDTTNCVKDGGEDERKRLCHDVRSDARKGNQQAGSKLLRSMVSVSSFNTLLIHCYYFTHTWLILRPYTKDSMGTDEVGIKRGYSRDIVLFVQQLRRMSGFLKEYFRAAMDRLLLRFALRNDGRISRLGILTIFCVLFSFASVVEAQAQELREGGATGQTVINPLHRKDTTNVAFEASNKPNIEIANMLQQKKEYKVNHDFKKPFVAHGNGVDSESVLFQSVLTGYQKGYKSQMMRPIQAFIDGKLSINGGTSYRLGCYNIDLLTLYEEAFIHGRRVLPRNRVVLEVNDSNKLTSDLKGAKYVEWLEKNGYCYELTMPVAVGRMAVYTQMQHDLTKMFPQYTASIQKRKIDSYALVRTSKKDKLKTKGGKPAADWDQFGFSMQNYYGLDYFLQQLEYYLQKELPVINKTGYEDKIDIDLKANLSSIEELNKALAAYDLQFVGGLHTMDVLVISDSGREPIEFHANPADYSDRPRNFDWQPLRKGGI